MDCSPPGSSVHGIFQPRVLEWVAISFSKAGKGKVKVTSLSCVRLLETPWTAAHQAPPSMGFSSYASSNPYLWVWRQSPTSYSIRVPRLKTSLLFYNLIQGNLKVQRPQVYIEELKHWYIIKNYSTCLISFICWMDIRHREPLFLLFFLPWVPSSYFSFRKQKAFQKHLSMNLEECKTTFRLLNTPADPMPPPPNVKNSHLCQ